MHPIAALFLIIFGAFNLIVVVVCIALGIWGNRRIKNNKKISGTILLLLAFYPVLAFAVTLVMTSVEMPLREYQKAAWLRKPVPADFSIKSIETFRTDASWLVASGISATAIKNGQTFDQDWGRDCVQSSAKRASVSFSDAVLARNAFFSCAKESHSETMIEPEIQYFKGMKAPNRNKKCRHVQTLELRWSPQLGGELIEFKEKPHKRKIDLPMLSPFLSKSPVFLICRETQPGTDLDQFLFAANSLGFKELSDFPRRATEEDLLFALQYLNTEYPKNEDAALVLLGQWPSTPAISNFIRTEIDHSEWTYDFLVQATNPQVDEKLVPYLGTHAADFLAICPRTVRKAKYCEDFNQKLKGAQIATR